ncbi:MAG: glycosyltransferase family 2 protein, partial [Caulobacterales bacterium]|nr:glycosyltransferase family 2 protein [Caulobacterales bacterium]
NGNPEAARARLAARAAGEARLSVLSGHGNVGFARGCNLGAAAASAELLAFVNPDAILERGAAARLAETGAGLARPWIVGGRVLGLDGREQAGSRRDLPTPWRLFVQATGLSALAPRCKAFRPMHHEGEPVPDGPIEVGAVSGAFFLMRRDDYDALGGLDEGYFAHVEDIDLCRRVWDAGGRVVHEPRARVRHEGATSPASPARIARLKGAGFARYFRKFAGGPVRGAFAWAGGPLIVAAALAVGVLGSGRRRHASQTVKARDESAC